MTDISKELFALYYQNSEFVGWIAANDFQLVGPDTIGKYFSLYSRIRNCQRRQCVACAGKIPSWTAEQQIIDGKLVHNRCQVFEELQREAAAKDMANRTQIPPVFADSQLDELIKIRGDARQAIRRYIIDYPKVAPTGLYLYSAERRIGRTTAMWCIVKELLAAQKLHNEVLLTTAAMFSENLIKDATTTWDHPLFERARTCELLMIDDFGQENYTRAYTEKLLALLEHRCWYKLPVIVSSTRNKVSWAWSDGQEPEVFSKVVDTTRLIRLDEADAEDII